MWLSNLSWHWECHLGTLHSLLIFNGEIHLFILLQRKFQLTVYWLRVIAANTVIELNSSAKCTLSVIILCTYPPHARLRLVAEFLVICKTALIKLESTTGISEIAQAESSEYSYVRACVRARMCVWHFRELNLMTKLTLWMYNNYKWHVTIVCLCRHEFLVAIYCTVYVWQGM